MKLFLILVTVVTVVFSSCKKDEDDAGTLEGTWSITKVDYHRYENSVLRSTSTEYVTSDDDRMFFSFRGNLWDTYDFDDAVSYDDEETFIYSNGRLMLYDDDDLEFDFAVKTLTRSRLELILEEEYESRGITIKETRTLHFDRK